MYNVENFQKRLDRLGEEQRECESRLLRDLHQRAIDLTNGAGSATIKLADAAAAESERFVEWLKWDGARLRDVAEAIVKDCEALASRVTKNSGEDWQLESASVLSRADGYEMQMLMSQFAVRMRSEVKPTPDELLQLLYGSILGPERAEFSLDATKKALSFLFGLAPIAGPVLDAATKIRDLANRNRNRAQAADAHIRYLEEYAAALRLWIRTAEDLTKRLEACEYL